MKTEYVGKKISKDLSTFLDLVRGLSAQMVLFGHLLGFYAIQKAYGIPIIQNYGVLIFFILSGFLITQTTLLKENYTFRKFVIDRFSRIFYTMIPTLVLVVVIDLIIIRMENYRGYYNNGLGNFFVNIFQFQGYPFMDKTEFAAYGSDRPLWTVSVEWWIYIAFGFLYYGFVLKQKQSLLSIFLFLLSLPLVLYYIDGRGGGLSIYWFFGLVLAIIYNKFQTTYSLKNFAWILIVCLMGLVYRAFFHKNMYDFGIAFFTCIMILLFFYPPEIVKKNILKNNIVKFSKFLASYSYSLYLIHYTLVEFLLCFLKEPNWINFFLIITIVNVASWLFYLAFEKNYYKLKNFLQVNLLQQKSRIYNWKL